MSLLELIKYIFLGLVQGVTEVMPISSSGHVAIFQKILNIMADEGLLFLTLVNLGSLFAIIFHFRSMIGKLIKGFFQYIFKPQSREKNRADFHYVWKIVIATVPTAFVGVFLSSFVDEIYQKFSLILVGFGLLVTSTFLYIVRFTPNKNITQKLTYKDALVIGIVQPFAILPGLSRSGITTSTGLLRKVSMDTALSFSFMLYIPLSFGSAFQFLIRWMTSGNMDVGFDADSIYQYIYYFCAFVASVFATKVALRYVFKWFRQGKLVYFAAYTLILGLIALVAGVILY